MEQGQAIGIGLLGLGTVGSEVYRLLQDTDALTRAVGRPLVVKRVAVARAVVLHPRLVLADEPTGNLDPQTADEVHQLLHLLNGQLGITLVIATHNERLTRSMGRTLRLREGRLFEERG